MEWKDTPLPEDAAINAAHPLRSGRHDLYAEAMYLVGACHSKGKLVNLVTWLLLAREDGAKLKQAARDYLDALEDSDTTLRDVDLAISHLKETAVLWAQEEAIAKVEQKKENGQ
jgi:hypothetical protein